MTSGKPRTCMTLGISTIHYTGAKIYLAADFFTFFYSHTFKGATIFSKNCTGVFLIPWNLAPVNVRTPDFISENLSFITITCTVDAQGSEPVQYGVHSSVSFYDLKIKITPYNIQVWPIDSISCRWQSMVIDCNRLSFDNQSTPNR